MPKRIAGFLAALSAVTVMLASGGAYADDEFDVSVSTGQVMVTAKSGWHINKDYSWKILSGSTKIDKSHFKLTEGLATASDLPKGAAKLKGAVCSGDKCKTFEKDIVIQ